PGCSEGLELMPAARTGPSLNLLLAVAVPVVAVLALLPRLVDLYQTELLIYGVTFAIAALGFNLLLGYTGLLSFGHSAYFGTGAYARFVYAYYYYVLVVFLVAVAVMWVIVHSPFGKALQAIRDNETRAGFVGIRVRRYRWIAFVISGLFTGLAGALWVPLNGLTTPEILYLPFSGEIVFMNVLVVFRTFLGLIVGAIAL